MKDAVAAIKKDGRSRKYVTWQDFEYREF